jgi:hypothetical protein
MAQRRYRGGWNGRRTIIPQGGIAMEGTHHLSHLRRTREKSIMKAEQVPSSSGSTTSTVYVYMAKSWGVPAALARTIRANAVSTCRPNKPNLTNAPACTVGAGLVVNLCVEGVHGRLPCA